MRTCFCVLLCVLVFGEVVGGQTLDNCLDTRHFYRAKGWRGRDVPPTPISGGELRICPRGLSCCTPKMENIFKSEAHSQLKARIKGSIKSLLQTFKSKAQKFDDFVVELLRKSKNDLHSMFKKTYGGKYEQNAHVFETLFRDFEVYFTVGRKDLDDIMNELFQTLFLKMFQLMNLQYRIDDRYLKCVGSYTKYRPFLDVPSKLTVQVKRAFVATRTYSLSLHTARDVLQNLLKVNPPSECQSAVTRMSYCSVCQGFPDIKPCSNFCSNVMKGCLAQHAEINSVWNEFLDAMLVVGERLEGPFNIEDVVDPLNIKISEAIMNFQESGVTISNTVIQECGQPPLQARMKRWQDNLAKGELQLQTVKFDNRRNYPPSMAAGTSIDRIVKDTRTKVNALKDFWKNLPYQICNDEDYAAQPMQNNCWNGNGKNRYDAEVVGEGLANQISNPEVKLKSTRVSPVIQEQKKLLSRGYTMLRQAYDGQDVKWPNKDDVTLTDDEDLVDKLVEQGGSGSGSGPEEEEYEVITTGSGDATRRPPVITYGYDDDDDDDRIDEGSGHGYYDREEERPRTPVRPEDNVYGITPPKDKNPPNNVAPDARPHGAKYNTFDVLYKIVLPCVMVWFGQTVEGYV